MQHDIEEVRSSNREAEGIQYVLGDSAKFFWYRFLFNVLDRLRHTDIAKRELISHVRDLHQHNRYQLDTINEFERTYCPEHVITWYTKDCFFYLGLNQAVRNHDINEIFLWRAYIQDLDKSLQQLRVEKIQEPDFKQLSVFRGQFLHVDDVNRQRMGIGQLITMTSFISTSYNFNVARIFTGDNTPSHLPLQSVVYKITIESYNAKSVYADVRAFSIISDEEECLFSLRSLFRLERVEFVDNHWQIDLTVVNEDDQQFSAAINPWKATIGEQSFFSGHYEPLFTRYLNIENGSFLSFQLLIDLILRLDRNEFAREEMIEMCRLKYADRPADLEKIDKFERKYAPENAAEWYTADSFLYRLLNNSLRLEDIDTLFKLRCYIYDLHNQLYQLQTPSIQSLLINQSILTLYRGQRMSTDELQNLRKNVGNLISMNSFLSTTNNVQAAVFFAGDGSLDITESEVSVLYQITVDMSIPHSIPFAEIQYESIFEGEDEVLFSMASVFRIDVVEQYGQLWVADLTLINKEDEKWNELTAHLNN